MSPDWRTIPGLETIKPKIHTVRFVIGSLDIGGTEKHLSLILPRLKTAAFTPVVITLTHKGVLSDGLERAGIRILAPPRWVRRIQRLPVLGPVATVIYLSAAYLKVPARLSCLYLPGAYYIGSIAAMITGEGNRMIMFRRSLNHYQKKWPVLSRIERYLHKKQLTIVGNSRAVVQELVVKEQVPEHKTRLIYNGIDTSLFGNRNDREAVRRSLGLEDDETVLCIVANLIPYKGHEDLIDALAGIAGKIRQPWSLLCAGTGSEVCSRSLAERVISRGLEDHVRWLGRREDIPQILTASDIGLVVSHQEGFSNSVLEGMASGLPMIVTDVGGNREAIEHKKSGLLVKPHDPAGLGEAILLLMNDREQASQYAAAARARVQDYFSLDRCVEDYQALFKAVLKE